MFVVRREPGGEYIIEKSNPSQIRTFSLEQIEIDGVSLKGLLDKETYERVAGNYDKCIDQNTPLTYEEKHIIDESGERFWITTITPVVDKQLGFTRIFGISREVTQVHQAEKVLKEHNEILERKVQERTLALDRALKQMEALAVTDKLTNLYNRHKIDEVLHDEISRAQRYRSPFAVLMVDIDNFKEVNDNFGHHVGDMIIKEFAAVLSEQSRQSDTLGRWGGEEFLIIIPESCKETALHSAKRLKERIQEHRFGVVGTMTASIGLTLFKNHDTAESLIKRADDALYTSKNSGRNLVSFV
jgi:diguanylate cyclase (GGDEF)-like protein/PAS domain S-box-containing protein